MREGVGVTYDSRPDTRKHIAQVRSLLVDIRSEFDRRGAVHDASKLKSPEVEVFDEFTPKLKHSTYGSDEYREFLVGMGAGLKHHYENNRHHPEHFPEGIDGMNLLDVLEMLADWKAATMRHDDGDLGKSIEINQKRFGYDDRFKGLLHRTALDMGWL